MPLAWTGGNSDGGLGTSFEAIAQAIDRAWSDAGVAILVDLGGAETNSEMAIEALPPPKRKRVVVCNAPIVEGAVVAATEASYAAVGNSSGTGPQKMAQVLALVSSQLLPKLTEAGVTNEEAQAKIQLYAQAVVTILNTFPVLQPAVAAAAPAAAK